MTKFCDNPLPRSLAHTYGLLVVRQDCWRKEIQRPAFAVLNRKERRHPYRHIRPLDARLCLTIHFIGTEHANQETYMANAGYSLR
jgi:hypothetical protein